MVEGFPAFCGRRIPHPKAADAAVCLRRLSEAPSNNETLFGEGSASKGPSDRIRAFVEARLPRARDRKIGKSRVLWRARHHNSHR